MMKGCIVTYFLWDAEFPANYRDEFKASYKEAGGMELHED